MGICCDKSTPVITPSSLAEQRKNYEKEQYDNEIYASNDNKHNKDKNGHQLGGKPVKKGIYLIEFIGTVEEEREKRLKAIDDRMNKNVFNKAKKGIFLIL